MQKLLSRYALLIAIISFSGCGKLPIKPSINSGILISQENTAFYVNNQTGESIEVPVCINNTVNEDLNKTILHSNKDWGKILLYIKLLERAVPRSVKNQLRGLRDLSKTLNQRAINGL